MSASIHTSSRYHRNNNFHQRSHRSQPFTEDKNAAFFLGKLNKHHDREQIYNQLLRLTKQMDFYICKFDMPYGPNGRGNQGFAFVHCKTRGQARKIIAKGHIRLGNQDCEVKSYGGRNDCAVNDRATPDSGSESVSNDYFKQRNPHKLNNVNKSNHGSTRFINPLNSDNDSSFSTVRSRVHSGIQISESESHEEQQKVKIHLDLTRETNNLENTQTNVGYNADSATNDLWIREKTEYISEQVNDLSAFMVECLALVKLLNLSENHTIETIKFIMGGGNNMEQHTDQPLILT
jgi:hypothetical protein